MGLPKKDTERKFVNHTTVFSTVSIELRYGPMDFNKIWTEFFCGGVAGACGIVVTQPIDTVKIRIQCAKDATISGVLGETIKHEGIRGLFKGVASPTLTCGMMNATLFLSFSLSSEAIIAQNLWFAHEPISLAFLAGCAAGIPAAFINSPTELIKCHAQTNRQNIGRIREEFTIFKSLVIQGRIMRGLGITILRDIPSYGVYFSSYEMSNLLLDKLQIPTLVQPLISGGVAGSVAWLSIYPFDVLKTVWQTDFSYKSIEPVWQKLRNEKRFWRGFGATLLRGWPQNAVVFSVYEALKTS